MSCSSRSTPSHPSSRRSNRLILISWLAATAAALAATAACELLTPAIRIADITARPAEYLNREVVVRGVTQGVTKLPFIADAFYTVRDETGSIVVVTQAPLPAEGQRVTVGGTVTNVAVIQGRSFGAHLREIRRQ